MLLKNKVRWKYLLFPSGMCLAEPTPALSSVGKAVLPGLHHPDVNLGYVPLSASKQNQAVSYASITHLALQIEERCGLIQVILSSLMRYSICLKCLTADNIKFSFIHH